MLAAKITLIRFAQKLAHRRMARSMGPTCLKEYLFVRPIVAFASAAAGNGYVEGNGDDVNNVGRVSGVMI
jgi:hypothetical protein